MEGYRNMTKCKDCIYCIQGTGHHASLNDRSALVIEDYVKYSCHFNPIKIEVYEHHFCGQGKEKEVKQ